jgi:hypothetical protein
MRSGLTDIDHKMISELDEMRDLLEEINENSRTHNLNRP